MKITGILLLVAGLHASAGSFSQEVTLKVHNMPLKDVLSEVRKQTGYTFFFKKGALSNTRPVTVTALKVPLATFLDMALKDQPLKYEISVKTITLLPRPDAIVTFDNQQKKWAWYQEIKGIVTGADGVPLAGASVKVKGTSAGTSTDATGRFTINAEVGQTLVITFIGYNDQQIKVTQQTSITIQLERAETSLEAVVVNKGYYTEKKKLSVGNVSTVKAEDIERQPVSNPLSALQGRVPGMVITQTTGMPGSAFRVQVRGRNSINSGNDPLYVIDGIPYPASTLNGMTGARNDVTIGGSPLSFLNPSDIESIDVLKDADATAIYGSRGANGVILITTKKGKAGKAQVTANVQHGVGKVGHFMKLLNTRQYLDMRYEAFKNDNIDWRSPSVFTAFDLKNYDTTRYTDWQKELLGGSAEFTDAQVSMSGGTENAQYLIGGGYNRQTTVFPGSANDQRGSVHYSLNATTNNKRFKAFLTGSYVLDNNKMYRDDMTDFALNLPPMAPALYSPDGSVNWQNGNWVNPLGRSNAKFERKGNNFISNLVLSYNILKGLALKTTLGYNQMLINETSTTPISSYNPTVGIFTASADFATFTNTTWIVEPQIDYRREIWKGELNVLVGSTIQKNTTEGMMVNATGYISDALLGTIASAGTLTPMGNQARSYKYNSLYGRLNYNIADKYLVNFVARRDGSDRFGVNNRFGNFAAVGLGWVFSNENLVANNIPWLSFGKIRASYGSTGNDRIDEFRFRRNYSVTTSTFQFQGVRGLAPLNLSNPDFQWEVNKKLEAGIELGFLEDKISASVSFYRNRSDNQLIDYRVPAHTGFNIILTNWPALVENRGWEFTLNTNGIKLGPVRWSSGFNLTFARNELVDFPNLENTSYAQTLFIGKPLGLTKVYDFVGMDPNTGLYQFLTKSGKKFSGIYPESLNRLTDQTLQIDRTPEFYGGFQNNFTYKGFELDFLFQFVKQVGLAYRAAVNPGAGTAQQGNQPIEVLDRWQKPGDIKPYMRFNADRSISFNNTSFVESQGNYQDASFIRLKNVQLAYDFTKLLGKRFGISYLKAFVQAQNVLTITSFFGLDPENQSGTSLPPLRVITGGIKITI